MDEYVAAPLLLQALEDVANRLEAWMELADDEDARYEDYVALKSARALIAEVKGQDNG
jgi:hypothetical protein